jgi:hypothetical protein
MRTDEAFRESEGSMKIKKLLLVLLSLAVVVSAQAVPLPFSTTRYEAPSFSALFPLTDGTKPQNLVTDSQEVAVGNTGLKSTMYQYAQSLSDGRNAFMVLVVDSATTLDSTPAQLDRMLDSALGAGDFKSYANVLKANTTVGSLPGRSMTATAQFKDGTDYVVYYRIAIKNGARVFQLIVLCQTGTNCSQADAEQFFNSVIVK